MIKYRGYLLLYISTFILLGLWPDDPTVNESRHQLVHTGISTFFDDYGTEGRTDTVTLTLLRGMQPGSILSYVARSDNNGTLSMHDNQDKVLFKMDLWFQHDILHLDSDIGDEMGDNLPNPVSRCLKTNTIIVNQADGYKIFINRYQTAFFKHRSDNPVKYINFDFDKFFKIYYLTTEAVTNNI